MVEVNNCMDIVDSRDILERIEELESYEDDDSLSASELEELETLRELAEESEGSPDWIYGETLIRDSYFTEYAQQLAEDIGSISTEYQWPQSHIDWEAAADHLKVDYFSVEWDGVDYWIRS